MNAAARGGALTGALAVWLATTAAAGVVTIPPALDNTLFQDATGSLSNGAGPALFAGNNGQSLARRALLRFDVGGNLPAGAVVTDVTLTLNVSNATDAIPRTFTLHRVLAAWGEGTSSTSGGAGAPATAGDATWLHRFWPGLAWGSAGGDFAPGASGSQVVTDVGTYTWTGPTMAIDVQAWLDDATHDFGWVLVGEEDAPNTARRFDSRENAAPAARPALTIRYALRAGVDGPAVAGVVLGPCRPNPAAGPVRFEFTLPAPARAALVVGDVAGRRIATVTDRGFGAGRHEAAWDGRDARGRAVAGGVYVYRLVVDGRIREARMLMVVR